MRSLITASVLYCFLITTSYAQTGVEERPYVSEQQNITTESELPISPDASWEVFSKQFAKWRGDLQIVTKIAPKKKEQCHVREVTTDGITCVSHQKVKRTYPKEKIASVFSAHHTDFGFFPLVGGFLAATGGAAYGAFLVAPILAASIPLAGLAFVLAYCTLLVIAFGGGYDAGETLLYRA
jgi:hypothetical protein